jgi:hypothetical protein
MYLSFVETDNFRSKTEYHILPFHALQYYYKVAFGSDSVILGRGAGGGG